MKKALRIGITGNATIVAGLVQEVRLTGGRITAGSHQCMLLESGKKYKTYPGMGTVVPLMSDQQS